MEGKPKKKKAKRILVAAVVIVTFLYLVPGVIGGAVVPSAILGHRGLEIAQLDEVAYKVYKQRKDYGAMDVREVHHFISDGNKLTGYLYGKDHSKGTVIHAHGMNLCSDAHEAGIANYYLEQGYRVFMVDLTASGESGGLVMGTLSQSYHDVTAAAEYLKEQSLIVGEFVLSGYSWGAHGAAMAMAKGVAADKLVAFSGFDCAYDELVAMAAVRTAGFAYVTVPPFALGARIRLGDEAFNRASDVLKKVSKKCFFVQGSRDGTVPYNVSLAKAMKGTKATIYETDDTHLTPWFSREARDYFRDELKPKIDDKSIDREAFLATVDKERSSELDPELFSKLGTFLAS